MSVINRMLADLEQRDAPAARGPGALAAAGQRGRRRHPGTAMRRLLPAALALALVVVAAVLWLQRGPELLAWLTAAGPSAPVADGPRTDDADAAAATAEAEAVALPALVGLEFSRDGDGARLALAFDGPPGGQPRYVRSGSQLTLRVAARPDDAVVPAPPGGQDVFRALSVEGAGGRGTVIRLDVAADARFEVRDEGERVVLAGQRPAPVSRAAARPPHGPAAGAAAAGDVAAAGGARAQSVAEDEPGPGGAAQRERVAREAVAPEGREAKAGVGAERDDAPAAGGTQSGRAAGNDTDAAGEIRAQAAGEDDAGDGDEAPAEAAAEDDAPPGGEARAEASADADAPAPAEAGAAADDTDDDAPAAATGGGARTGSVRKLARTSPAVRAVRRYRAAREALSAGNVAVARGRLREALEADPDQHGARELLAALLRRAGDAPAARKVLAEGLERASGRPGFAKPYARLLVDSGELGRAAEVLEPAAAAAAGDPGYHALVAAIAQRLERHERAARAYTRALEIDAGEGRWWLGLGISLVETGHPGEARAAFREARATGDLTPRLDSWARGRIEALGNDGEQ